MSGRGRGKRAGSVGPGRPAKYPNLNSEDSQQAQINKSQATGPLGPAGPSQGQSGGLVDILNQLDSNKRNEMLSLVGQYKNRVLSLNDFMMRARDLLGERLYLQLSRDMNNAAAARGANVQAMPVPLNVNVNAMVHNMPPVSAMGSMMRAGPMHSMPQIYGGPVPNNFPPVPTIPLTAPSSSLQAAAPFEVDVTKMDTSSLQDVMQYSGVDLKAEAELLYREHESILSGPTGTGYVDHRLKFDYFFNPFKFRAIVQHALQRHFFSTTLNTSPESGRQNKPLGITEEAVHLLGIAIQKRLIGILRRLSEISRHRVDYGRGKFKIKIENDPKKQLWLQEKLFIEGVGEDKRRATSATGTVNQTLLNPPSLASIGATAANKVNPSVTTATATTTAAAVNSGASSSGPVNAPVKQSSQPSGSGSVAASTSASSGTGGGDDTVKTKLANVTALAALGIRQKSWMSSATTVNTSSTGSSGTGNPSSNSQSSSTANTTATSNEEKEPVEVYQHPLANFYSLPSSTPLTDSELRAQYFNRTISTVDLITCMESDPHLRRSRLLAVLHDALPRENKENSTENN